MTVPRVIHLFIPDVYATLAHGTLCPPLQPSGDLRCYTDCIWTVCRHHERFRDRSSATATPNTQCPGFRLSSTPWSIQRKWSNTRASWDHRLETGPSSETWSRARGWFSCKFSGRWVNATCVYPCSLSSNTNRLVNSRHRISGLCSRFAWFQR